MSQHLYRIDEANGDGRQHVKLSFLLLADLRSWSLSSLNVEFPIVGGKNCLRSELLKSLYNKNCTYIGNLWQDESYGCRTLHTALTCHLSFLTECIWLFRMSGCGSAEMKCTNFTFIWPCIVTLLFNETNKKHSFPNLFLYKTLHVSGSSSTHHQEYIRHWHMLYSG